MNNPWLKVLVFSLLFGAVGFLLGRQCGHGCGRDRGHCEAGAACDARGDGPKRAAACKGHHGAATACDGHCKGRCDGSCSGACAGAKKACCAGMAHNDSTVMAPDSAHTAAGHAAHH